MDYFLIITGCILVIAGISGSVLPFLPGPPLSFAALVLLHFTTDHEFSSRFLIIWAIITLLVVLIDYLIPVWGTKKFGGSKYGIWGSIIGLLAGILIIPPFGIIIGPFAGAIIGELVAGKRADEAFKAGFGSFVGFLAGTILKLVISGLMSWYFIRELFAG